MLRPAVLLASSAAFFAVASPAPAKELTLGQWTVRSETGSGACSASTAKADPQVRLDLAPDGKLALTLGSSTWSWTAKNTYAASLSTVGNSVWSGSATALDANTVRMDIVDGRVFDGIMSEGEALTAHVDTASQNFDVSGFKAARDLLRQCVAHENGF